MDKKIFSVDRLEGDLAVCISDDDEQVIVPRSSLGELQVHDVFSAYAEDGNLADVTPMPEERDRRLEKNRSRLHSLAKRTKNRS